MTARIDNKLRRTIYARDGWRCALCDSTQGIQIHHFISRGRGGPNHPHNLITLCAVCHAQAHGHDLYETGITAEDMEQYIAEYLGDFYAEEVWNPWRKPMP